MTDIIIVAIVIAIVALAGFYVYRQKKKGKKCIGCPYSDSCSSGCSCSESKDEK
jgi:hypothetical protein